MKQPESPADTLAPELRKEADLRELSRLYAKYVHTDPYLVERTLELAELETR